MKTIVYLIAGLFVVCAGVTAQMTSEVDALVSSRIRMIEEGKASQVKAELTELISKHQNHPGILYLQGLLATNGAEAAKYYQMVLDNFPKSEWADDALYRIYLYYHSLGLERTAELKMQQLRKEYPRSPYLKSRVATQPPPDEGVREAPILVPTMPPVVRESVGQSGGAYTIQVGAFASMDNARRLKAYFDELGYPVEVQNKVRGGQSLHLVWVGSFSTSDEARKFGAEIRSKHKIESIVVSR